MTPGATDEIRLGVLAFGDSITNGGGELQWGVALQSWALWVARALGVPYSGYAEDGATVDDVIDRQIPAFRSRAVHREGHYDVGCLYIGVNDVRGLDWDPGRFEQGLRAALAFLAARCDRVLVATIPRDLGRPRAGTSVEQANHLIEREAAAVRARILDLRDFGARNLVMADHVHPTAFGQVAIAERALAALAADGLAARVRPSELIGWRTSRWGRLRGDLTYSYRHAKISARAAALRARFRLLPPRR